MRKIKSAARIGILEWFHMGDKEHVLKTIEALKELGITELRTGISWADYHSPQGELWLDWLITTLTEHLNVLPCLLYTPPSIGIQPKSSSPPKYPEYFADFTDKFLTKYGEHFEWIELWNEPNNTSEYDFRYDPSWDIFNKMITWASKEVHKHGKKVLLGGMSPVDPGWLSYMYEIGVMDSVDAFGIHGFPEVFDSKWDGWSSSLELVQQVMDYHEGSQQIWITETGYSTWKYDEKKQFEQFLDVLNTPVDRVYWYSLSDLQADYETVDGFHVDERDYFFGMRTSAGKPKLLYRMLSIFGLENIHEAAWLAYPYETIPENSKSILITGGAGFIGTNLADFFLSNGKAVTIYDSLAREGVEQNLSWLKDNHPANLNIRIADVRNKFEIREAVQQAEFVYHLAAQVAVTTGYQYPDEDFEVNIQGTLNVLEAIRLSNHRPPIVFTSTNKVYGNLDHFKIHKNHTRYIAEVDRINEKQALDFYSPYGCSKGSADAYVMDYARIYGLKTVVFRMSCIYGPHQFGTEDQGWVAHFLIQARKQDPLTIYGDGKQIRDILYVADLVQAFHSVYQNIEKLSGEAFNIGGGINNTISLNELLIRLETFTGSTVDFSYDAWRPGDQKYYVSDISKFNEHTGWEPTVSIQEGLERLNAWLEDQNIIENQEEKEIALGE